MKAFPVDVRERVVAAAHGRSMSEVQAAEVCAASRAGVVEGSDAKPGRSWLVQALWVPTPRAVV